MEGWMSGLNQQFTKLSFLNWNREFESHTLRKTKLLNNFVVYKINGRLAQLVEHLIDVERVTDSSSVPPTQDRKPPLLEVFCCVGAGNMFS